MDNKIIPIDLIYKMDNNDFTLLSNLVNDNTCLNEQGENDNKIIEFERKILTDDIDDWIG